MGSLTCRRHACRGLALLTVAVAAGVPADAATGQELRPLLTGSGSVALADGERWAVATTTSGMRVYDGRGAGLRAFDVDLAAACRAQFGLPRAVGGGHVAVECAFRDGDTGPRWLIYDLAASRAFEAAGMDRVEGSEGSRITGIGTRWISYDANFHHGERRQYLVNWRTGRHRTASAQGTRVADLGTEGGTRRICRGIGRPSRSARSFAYRAPYALELRGPLRAGSVVLRRCAGRARTISRRGWIATDAVLGSRAATFVEQRGRAEQAVAVTLADRRVRRWRLPAGRGSVVAAGRHLLVTVSPPGGFTFDVLTARLR